MISLNSRNKLMDRYYYFFDDGMIEYTLDCKLHESQSHLGQFIVSAMIIDT